MEPSTKRYKADGPPSTIDDALKWARILQDHSAEIPAALAQRLHYADLCRFFDVKNCPVCHALCPLCGETKPNPIQTRNRYHKGICKACGREIAHCVTLETFHEIRKLTIIKKNGDWHYLPGEDELMGEFTDEPPMWAALKGFIESSEADTATSRTVYVAIDGCRPVDE